MVGRAIQWSDSPVTEWSRLYIWNVYEIMIWWALYASYAVSVKIIPKYYGYDNKRVWKVKLLN